MPVNDTTVSLDSGVEVTCTVINTYTAPGRYSVRTSADPSSGSTVHLRQVIDYEVAVTRTRGTPTGISISDDLGELLKSATLVSAPRSCSDAACPAAAGAVELSGTRLTWTVPILDNPVAYRRFAVRVGADRYGAVLRTAVAAGPGGTCTDCRTTHLVAGRRAGRRAGRPSGNGRSASGLGRSGARRPDRRIGHPDAPRTAGINRLIGRPRIDALRVAEPVRGRCRAGHVVEPTSARQDR